MKKNLIVILLLFFCFDKKIYAYDKLAYKNLVAGEKNFSNKDLSGIDFSKIKNKIFNGYNFTNANLSNSIISEIDFSDSNLNLANMQDCEIKNSKFNNASLLGVDFKNSTLENVDFDNAKFGGSIKKRVNRDGVSFTKTFKTLFRKCNLRNIQFSNSFFDVGNKKVDRYKRGGTYFSDCNLDYVDFTNSKTKKLHFRDCILNNCKFNNLILEGKRGDRSCLGIENSKLDSCYFTDSSFENKYDLYGANKTIILRVDGLSKRFRRYFKEKGAYIPEYSVICNSDLHEDARKVHRQDKRNLIPKILDVAANKKNKVVAAIYPGDFCHMGDKPDWNLFIKKYYKPLKKYVKKQFFCVGNHDRWQREATTKEWLNMVFRTALGGSYAVDKIKKHYKKISGNKKWKKAYYKYHMNLTDFVCLGECPTMPNKEPVKWFVNKIAKDKWPKILFYHYTPLTNWSIGWWTVFESPRPTNFKFGKKAVNYFYNRIKHYKDKIALQVTGHDHSNQYALWRDIPTICVGGDRFALAHIDPQYPVKINKKWTYKPVVVAIEFIHPTDKTQIYYPCLYKIIHDHEKNDFVYRTFIKLFGKSPKYQEVKYYVEKWDEFGGSWEVEQKIKESDKFVKKQINKIYKKYLGRNADSSGLNHYLNIWKRKGKDKIENEIKNSKEARPKLLKKWYREYLNREPDSSGLKYHLNNWEKLGGTDKIENIIKNSEEARPKLLEKWFKKYLGRKPDSSGKKYYLNNWEKLGGADNIENNIKNSQEARSKFLEKWYKKYLGRKPDALGKKYYLENWDNLGSDKIEDSLKHSPESKVYKEKLFGK
ncbi:hypothetical protein GF385_02350 [Candidatus Dependentiae bacterium]|nr:hypothetical protein [Candidatus Dependentiae bacterium]